MKLLNSIKTFYTLVIALSILASCECYEDPGIVITETRALNEFDALKIETVGKVNLFAAEEFKIVIKTHDNIMKYIVTTVNDNQLIVQLTGKHNRINTLEFDIFAPFFTYIEQNDVADINCQDGFHSEKLQIVQNDVGDITLFNVTIDSLDIILNDVGNVELEGMSQVITARLEGVGEIHLFNVECKNADIDLSGTGDIEINASETLKIDLSGVGSVYYKGSPSMSVNHTGVGKVVSVD